MFDLCEQQFETIEFAADFPFQMLFARGRVGTFFPGNESHRRQADHVDRHEASSDRRPPGPPWAVVITGVSPSAVW